MNDSLTSLRIENENLIAKAKDFDVCNTTISDLRTKNEMLHAKVVELKSCKPSTSNVEHVSICTRCRDVDLDAIHDHMALIKQQNDHIAKLDAKIAEHNLENEKFKNSKNIKYFGITKESLEELKNQVEIIYYNSDDDFAIQLLTKQEDEIILVKNPKGKTFSEIYTTTKIRESEYQGSKELQKGDTLKVPMITLKEKKEFESIENKPFMFANGKEYVIGKALQTINFELNSKGGKIKSEAGADVWKNEGSEKPKEERHFYLDDTFTIFLIEKGKEVPYFAAKIDDIEKFQ